MIQCLKNVFAGEKLIDCCPRSFIKICYGRQSAKKKDLEYFKARNLELTNVFIGFDAIFIIGVSLNFKDFHT